MLIARSYKEGNRKSDITATGFPFHCPEKYNEESKVLEHQESNQAQLLPDVGNLVSCLAPVL